CQSTMVTMGGYFDYW
nr:immunoglobulin heavy chain junction region [Mus musculus]MBK4189733.1 immunoglobulin heavy chain junction region [Mus musculus]